MEEHLQPRVVRARQRLRHVALQTAGVLREQAFPQKTFGLAW